MKKVTTVAMLFTILTFFNLPMASAVNLSAQLYDNQFQTSTNSFNINGSVGARGFSVMATNKSKNPFHISLLKDGKTIKYYTVPANQTWSRIFENFSPAAKGNYRILLTCPSRNCGGGLGQTVSW